MRAKKIIVLEVWKVFGGPDMSNLRGPLGHKHSWGDNQGEDGVGGSRHMD